MTGRRHWDRIMPSAQEVLVRASARLPLPVCHVIGAGIGWMLSIPATRQRQVADINLRQCLPELDDRQRGRLRRLSLMHFGRMLAESGRIWLGPPAQVLSMVREIRGFEHVQAAFDGGRGVIFCAPHLGCWEIVNSYLSIRYPLTAMYRPQGSPIDPLILAGRERLGARLVPTDQSGVKALLAALRRGEAVGILPDQDARHGGLFVDFFGLPANTPALPAKLAAKTGAPVLLAYGERLSWGRGFRLHFLPGEAAIADPDPRVATAALNRDVERCIRALPEQYWWSYRRYRRRPPGAARLYPSRRRRKAR